MQRVYELQIRALLGTTAHFCKVVVLKLRAGVRVHLERLQVLVSALHRQERRLPLSEQLLLLEPAH